MRIYDAPARDFIEQALQANTDECIPWPFAVRASSGYPAYQRPRGHGPRSIDAHRYVCEQAHGQPEDGEETAHSCGNKICINPRHVHWRTHLDNMGEAKQHGTIRGGGIYRQRLFEQERLDIAASCDSLVTLSAKYGMSPSHMGKVRREMTQQGA